MRTSMAWDVIEHNPRLKKPLLAVLSICRENPMASRSFVEAGTDEAIRGALSLQAPSVLVDILIRNGALINQITVDGKPYSGSLESLQTNVDISNSAIVEQTITLAPLGEEVLSAYGGTGRLLELLEGSNADFRSVYLRLLAFCSEHPQSIRSTLEAQLEAEILVQGDPLTGKKTVYPQFFLDSLEQVGGIAWENAWNITDAGREMLKRFA
jgi:hypothetical protein